MAKAVVTPKELKEYNGLDPEFKDFMRSIKGIENVEDWLEEKKSGNYAALLKEFEDSKKTEPENKGDGKGDNAVEIEFFDTLPEPQNSDAQNQGEDWKQKYLADWKKWAEENNQEIGGEKLDDGLAFGIKGKDGKGSAGFEYTDENNVKVDCDPKNPDNDKYFDQLLKHAKENGKKGLNVKSTNSPELNAKLAEIAAKYEMELFVDGEKFVSAAERIKAVRARREDVESLKAASILNGGNFGQEEQDKIMYEGMSSAQIQERKEAQQARADKKTLGGKSDLTDEEQKRFDQAQAFIKARGKKLYGNG